MVSRYSRISSTLQRIKPASQAVEIGLDQFRAALTRRHDLVNIFAGVFHSLAVDDRLADDLRPGQLDAGGILVSLAEGRLDLVPGLFQAARPACPLTRNGTRTTPPSLLSKSYSRA